MQKAYLSNNNATAMDQGSNTHCASHNKSKTHGTGYVKPITCYCCKKPCHVMAVCHKRMAKLSADGNEEKLMQLVALAQCGNAPVTTVEEVIPHYIKSLC